MVLRLKCIENSLKCTICIEQWKCIVNGGHKTEVYSKQFTVYMFYLTVAVYSKQWLNIFVYIKQFTVYIGYSEVCTVNIGHNTEVYSTQFTVYVGYCRVCIYTILYNSVERRV